MAFGWDQTLRPPDFSWALRSLGNSKTPRRDTLAGQGRAGTMKNVHENERLECLASRVSRLALRLATRGDFTGLVADRRPA
jgi:hypothetical protein